METSTPGHATPPQVIQGEGISALWLRRLGGRGVGGGTSGHYTQIFPNGSECGDMQITSEAVLARMISSRKERARTGSRGTGQARADLFSLWISSTGEHARLSWKHTRNLHHLRHVYHRLAKRARAPSMTRTSYTPSLSTLAGRILSRRSTSTRCAARSPVGTRSGLPSTSDTHGSAPMRNNDCPLSLGRRRGVPHAG